MNVSEKKKIEKYIFSIARAAALSVCLVGCGKEKTDDLGLTMEAAVVPSAPAGAQSSAAQTAPFGTRHISQGLTENVSVDAEVTLPGKTQYSTHTLKMVDSDPERLFGIFSPEGHGSYQPEDHDGYYVVYEESSGKKLAVYEDAISYWAYDMGSGEDPMQDVETLMYYHTEEYPDAAPHDLSFMTVAEMEVFAGNLFNQLGAYWEPEIVKYATLSGQEILDYQKEVAARAKDGTGMGIPAALAEAQDTCYLEFNFRYDGLPLLGSEDPKLSSAIGMPSASPVTATMMFNADGLQSFTMYYPCTVEVVSESTSIISPEEALGVIQKQFESETRFGNTVIQRVWLEYIPKEQGKAVALTPYWCFEVIDPETKDLPGNWASAERINAITGENLAYGG